MTDFKIAVSTPVTYTIAKNAADKLELEIGEILNGKRKASKITVREIAQLITFVRQNEGMK